MLLNFKGDILKSPSGGAHIIFKEVETLKIKTQEQGKPVKRSFDEISIKDNIIQERVKLQNFIFIN